MYVKRKKKIPVARYRSFLVSGRDLACQQEVSLALKKKLRPSVTITWWISRSVITRGSCVFNASEHRRSRDVSVR